MLGQVEAAAAKDELKRLRKEMLRLKNEWTTLKALYESAKVYLFSLFHEHSSLHSKPVIYQEPLHTLLLLQKLHIKQLLYCLQLYQHFISTLSQRACLC